MNQFAVNAGVLALQGGFAEHQAILDKLGVANQQVKTVEDLQKVQALIIPGGESTVMSKFLDIFNLRQPILERVAQGMPIFGTCAGAILLANEIEADKKVQPLKLIDVVIKRNAYGSQIDSFVTELEFSALAAGQKIDGMFIRAPRFTNLGPNVEILSSYNGEPVLVRQSNILAGTFHPELVGETAVHEWFIKEFVA